MNNVFGVCIFWVCGVVGNAMPVAHAPASSSSSSGVWEEIGHSLGRTVLHDKEIQPNDRTVVDSFKIQSLAGPEYLLRLKCEGERSSTKAHELRDKDSYEYVLIKKHGGGSKDVKCERVQLVSRRNNSVVKEARNVRVATMDDTQFYNIHNTYFYGYGFGNYGGPFGTWLYEGRW